VKRKIAKMPSLETAAAAARTLLRQAAGGQTGKVEPAELGEVAATLAARIVSDGLKVIKEKPGIPVEAWFVLEDYMAAGVKLEGVDSPPRRSRR